MIHKLLCKMNIHKYVIKPEYIYSHTRKIEPYREINRTKLEDIKIIKVCCYRGKPYKNMWEKVKENKHEI